MHLRESRTSKFSGGACPRTPLGSKALGAFGKYTRLLLLSTHLCKNLLKPLVVGVKDIVHCTELLVITGFIISGFRSIGTLPGCQINSRMGTLL